MCELIYDAHKVALAPRGQRLISSVFGLSLYGNYYYYYLLSPFNPTSFGFTCGSSFLLSFLLLNSAMSSQMTVVEMMVLPPRDMVRFVLMSGGIIETPISSVTLIKVDRTRLTYLTKPSGKQFKIVVDLNKRYLKSDYVNTELLAAIGHPDVHKI